MVIELLLVAMSSANPPSSCLSQKQIRTMVVVILMVKTRRVAMLVMKIVTSVGLTRTGDVEDVNSAGSGGDVPNDVGNASEPWGRRGNPLSSGQTRGHLVLAIRPL